LNFSFLPSHLPFTKVKHSVSFSLTPKAIVSRLLTGHVALLWTAAVLLCYTYEDGYTIVAQAFQVSDDERFTRLIFINLFWLFWSNMIWLTHF